MSSLDDFYKGGPKTTAEAFPPICLRSHWNPTMVTNHILPSMPLHNSLALDPRPSTKICTTYFNSSAGDAPLSNPSQDTPLEIPTSLRGGPQRKEPLPSAVMPPGGAASRGFPYGNFDPEEESELSLLYYPLTKCSEGRYIPVKYAPATNELQGVRQKFTDKALDVASLAGCRGADDDAAWQRSSRMFMNPTRYDRTTDVPTGLRGPDKDSLCK
jgi:hypothetical protein